MTRHADEKKTYIDENGEHHFCPPGAGIDSGRTDAAELDNCVEASTVGRYAGHLKDFVAAGDGK